WPSPTGRLTRRGVPRRAPPASCACASATASSASRARRPRSTARLSAGLLEADRVGRVRVLAAEEEEELEFLVILLERELVPGLGIARVGADLVEDRDPVLAVRHGLGELRRGV